MLNSQEKQNNLSMWEVLEKMEEKKKEEGLVIVSLLENIDDYPEIMEDSVWEPICPYCKSESGCRVEIDADYTVTCECCDKTFHVKGF